MKRRTFIATFSSLLAAKLVLAQPAGKIYKIGYLQARSPLPVRDEVFLRALRDLGWIEGGNISIAYRFGDGKVDRLVGLATELARLQVDVIVTSGTTAVRAAREATSTIPIVMMSGEPVSTGLVASLARPGGNITGLTHVTNDLIGKRLELLKQIVPNAARVAAMLNPSNPGEAIFVSEMESTARALGLELLVLKVETPDQFDRAFSSMTERHIQGVFVLEDPIFTSNPARVADMAARYRLPAMYGTAIFAHAGGLMSYGANFTDLYRRAAEYVDKILKGAKPADLPIEQPTRFELVINVRTAKTLGLTIPQSLLLRADEVIQ